MDLRKDAELATIDEMTQRIVSLRNRADELSSRPCRSHSSEAFQKKQAQIAKLNGRADRLHIKRAGLLRTQRTAAVENNLDAFLVE